MVSEAFKINGGILAQPNELMDKTSALVLMYVLLKRSDKALLGISSNFKTTRDIFGMLNIVFPDFPNMPRILTMISPMSPLAIDKDASETLRVCAEYSQPIIIAPGTIAGSTGPISLAGNISLANAEILGINVLAQMISPGLPIVYGFAATTSDMRNMSINNASAGFLKQAKYGAMMAKYYGLPCRSGGGMSDAGGLTAQAGVESAMGLFESFSVGANLVMHSTGSLHSFNSVCYEKFVLDLETIDRLLYCHSELSVSDNALAFDVVEDAVKNGVPIVTSEHTLDLCRTEPWQPTVSLHGKSKGEPNSELYASIQERMDKMLKTYRRPEMNPETEAVLDRYALNHGISEEVITKASI
jgi:trimethylamine--corrinoid protein Co-methyltransferase